MGFFDRIRGKRLAVKWEKITYKNIEKLYEELDDQQAEEVFEELQRVIATNNKRKALVKASVAILKMAGKIGINIAKA